MSVCKFTVGGISTVSAIVKILGLDCKKKKMHLTETCHSTSHHCSKIPYCTKNEKRERERKQQHLAGFKIMQIFLMAWSIQTLTHMSENRFDL